MNKGILVLLMSLMIIGCSESSKNKGFKQVGYLKDNSKNRIYTYAYSSHLSGTQIRSYAESLMSTSGQMMAAYFYPKGSLIPADGITLSKSIFQANDVLYKTKNLGKWKFVYMKNFNGAIKFINCDKTPKNDLCRQ